MRRRARVVVDSGSRRKGRSSLDGGRKEWVDRCKGRRVSSMNDDPRWRCCREEIEISEYDSKDI